MAILDTRNSWKIKWKNPFITETSDLTYLGINIIYAWPFLRKLQTRGGGGMGDTEYMLRWAHLVLWKYLKALG